MAGKCQVVLACVFLTVALCVVQSSAQEEESSHDRTHDRTHDHDQGSTGPTEHQTLSPPPSTPDPLMHNLQFSLPIVIVCILLFIMAIVVIVVMRKARYGQFCCFKPKMRFRYVDDDVEGTGSHTPPPTYKMTEIIAPPDYNDALQDVLVSQQDKADAEKEEEEKDDMVEVPLNENETEDDRAPLNP